MLFMSGNPYDYHDIQIYSTRIFPVEPISTLINVEKYGWSPNERVLVYITSEGQFHRLNLVTGNDSAVPLPDDVMADMIQSTEFSPDEKHVALVYSTGVQPAIQIWTIENETPAFITALPDVFPTTPTHPVWTPDGQRLVYSRRDGDDELWQFDVATQRREMILDGVQTVSYAGENSLHCTARSVAHPDIRENDGSNPQTKNISGQWS
jgi:Tol biopolymer transport system component